LAINDNRYCNTECYNGLSPPNGRQHLSSEHAQVIRALPVRAYSKVSTQFPTKLHRERFASSFLHTHQTHPSNAEPRNKNIPKVNIRHW
jgi:hypothetical protein